MGNNPNKPQTKEAVETNENVEETVVAEKTQVIGVVCNCDQLNVRKEPNKNATVIDIVKAGTEFKIEGESGIFYKVDKGYVMKDYISVK